MYNPLLLPDLRVMLDEDDRQGLSEFCDALHPAVTAEVLEGLPSADAWRVLSNCGFDRQGEIFGFLELPFQIELVEAVEREQLSKLIEAMAPDNRVDLLERLDPEHVESLLPLMAQAERADIRKLLSYPDDSAGSIMTTEYASLPEDIAVAEAIEQLRRQAAHRETIYYIYILDERRQLRGIVSLQDLILAKPDAVLSEIMQHDVISVRVDDDRELVAQELGRYDFIAIPVVDHQNHLVGIVTHDDVLDVVQEEATEDAHRLGAVSPLEDSYLSTPIGTITWKRGIWLALLLGTAFATASVLDHYVSDLQHRGEWRTFDWMILFIPLVLGSGGNAGSQSATLVIRMLALDTMTRGDTLRLIGRELLLASALGGGLMLLAIGTALPFVEATQAVVVGLAVFLVVGIGIVAGTLLPLGFRRIGMDPALMSNPLISALVDMLGVTIYFSVAGLLLSANR